METVCIDGSFGEGGGQVLRTGLTLAALTGKHLRINNIRASRPNPGLAKQHLACVSAACTICSARCTGDELRSTTLDFEPGAIRSGEYHFDIGSAGSASLVIQTILPVLFTADGLSKVTVTGGTHNPLAPPFDFLKTSFLPALADAGFWAECKLLKHGFFPAGGGKIAFEIQPWQPNPNRIIDLCQPPVNPKIYAVVYTAKLPARVIQRQRKLLLESGLPLAGFEHIEVADSNGPGNCVVFRLVAGNRTTIFTAFGMKSKPSEQVVNEVVTETRNFLASGAGIDHFLADQLLIYMAMQKTSRLTTNELSSHLTTNIEVIKKFLPVDFAITGQGTVFEICCRAL
jgi:RNA 3'-terminal phosphate cyclase (ATP)